MMERDKQLVRDSFPCLREEAGPLALLFYGRLFALEPELRAMFHGDIGRQGQKLMEMLTAVVDGLDRMESLRPALEAMGQRHAGYGVAPRHYALVEASMAWAVAQTLETGGRDEVVEAWRKVLRIVSETMQEGAARVDPQG
jgi:nitric oxide dioxygenase